MCYSNCDRAELFLNGQSLGAGTATARTFPPPDYAGMFICRRAESSARSCCQGLVTVIDEIDLIYPRSLGDHPRC